MLYQIRTIRHNAVCKTGEAQRIYDLFIALEEDRGPNLFQIYAQDTSDQFTVKIDKYELEKKLLQRTTSFPAITEEDEDAESQ